MNHSREEIEGQKPSKLKAVKRASHMIQGLVVASVVSLSSPAYSQEKKIDAASTTSVATNDVPEYNKILEGTNHALKAEYISQKLVAEGKAADFLHAVIEADGNIQGDLKKADLIAKILSNKDSFKETVIGKSLEGYNILQQAIMLQAEQKALSTDTSVNSIARAVHNQNCIDFTESTARKLIHSVITNPEKLSINQAEVIKNFGAKLLGNDDVISSQLSTWVSTKDVNILRTAGIGKIYENMNIRIQPEITTSIGKIGTKVAEIASIAEHIQALRRRPDATTDTATINEIQNQEKALYNASTARIASNQQFLSTARSYIGVAQEIGQLFGNNKTAKDVGDALFVANKILTVAENINKFVGATNTVGSFTSGNMVGAAMNIVGMFASQGPSPEDQRHQQVMAELKRIGEQISKMREEMHDRFDHVDKSLEIISKQLVDIQNDIATLKNEIERSLDVVGRKIEMVQWDEFENKYNNVKICHATATRREDGVFIPVNLDKCKKDIFKMITGDSADMALTGRGLNTSIKKLAEELQKRGDMEYSIEMIRNILGSGQIDFTYRPAPGSQRIINPLIAQKILEENYLDILQKRGITQVDRLYFDMLISTLDQLDVEGGKMVKMTNNSFLDKALRLYDNKYSGFFNALIKEVERFQEIKSGDIAYQAHRDIKEHQKPIQQVNLVNPEFLTSSNPAQIIDIAYANWLIHKEEVLVRNTPVSFLAGNTLMPMTNGIGNFPLKFDIAIDTIYSPYVGGGSFNIPYKAYNNTLVAGVTLGQMPSGRNHEDNSNVGQRIICREGTIPFSTNFDKASYRGSDCIKAIEERLIQDRLQTISPPNGEAEKKKLADFIQWQYVSMRKEAASHIENQLKTSGTFRDAFDEWRGAYALLDSMIYFGLQFHREHDGSFAEAFARMNPEKINKHLATLKNGKEMVWDQKWNNDPLLLGEAFGDLVGPDRRQDPVTYDVRRRLEDIMKANPVIGLKTVKEMRASMEAVLQANPKAQ